MEHDTTIYYYYETRKRYNVYSGLKDTICVYLIQCANRCLNGYILPPRQQRENTHWCSRRCIFLSEREREKQMSSAYLNTHKSSTCDIHWYTPRSNLYLSIIFFFFYVNCQLLSDYSINGSY